jgi:hypothetical protein
MEVYIQLNAAGSYNLHAESCDIREREQFSQFLVRLVDAVRELNDPSSTVHKNGQVNGARPERQAYRVFRRGEFE